MCRRVLNPRGLLCGRLKTSSRSVFVLLYQNLRQYLYFCMSEPALWALRRPPPPPIIYTASVSIRQHTSYICVAGVAASSSSSSYIYSIRQHPSASVSIRQHTAASVSIRQHTAASVSIRQHTSYIYDIAYVIIRQHTSYMTYADVL